MVPVRWLQWSVVTMCEDYPCCGHTDGLGCNYVPDYKYIYAHALCEHELGYCDLVDSQ